MRHILVYLHEPTPIRTTCRQIATLNKGKHFVPEIQARLLEAAGKAKILENDLYAILKREKP